jgi:hypothetical protein
MTPVLHPFSPVFSAFCVRCGHAGWSGSLACGPRPFTYVGWCCQSDEEREVTRLAAHEAWESLSANERHHVRVRMFGASEAQVIGRREVVS